MSSTDKTHEEIALELTKAALASGVLTHESLSVTGETASKTTVSKAAVDAVYVVKLYQGIVSRLKQAK